MKDEKVEKYYKEEATDYNEEFYEKDSKYPTLKIRHNYILEMIDLANLPSTSNILDVGCGPGELILDVENKFEKLVGIDIAQEMIDIAHHKKGADSDKITFEVGDVEDLQFPDHSFDMIVLSGVIEYLKNEDDWLREIKRVLKKDGFIIINVTNKYSIRKWTSGMLEALKNVKPMFSAMNFVKQKVLKKGKMHHFPFKPRVHSPSQFDKFLRQNGFEKVTHNYFDFAILPAPFDTLFGFVTTPMKMSMEKFSKKNVILNGTGYIVLAKRTDV